MNTFVRAIETDEEFRLRVESEPLPGNMGELLDHAIERFGNDPVWVFVEQDLKPLTWNELGRMVAQSANAFVKMGVRKGSHVGVMLPDVPQFLAGWLALARIGAVMIPINPGYTPNELTYWLTDGDVEFLLIDGARIETLKAVVRDVPSLPLRKATAWGKAVEGFESWDALLEASSSEFEATDEVKIDDLLNIQYTSGTTGWPKGCLLSHRYWIVFGKLASSNMPDVKRIQCDLPFYYLGPLWRFAMAAFNGSALCVPPSFSLTRFRERIRDYEYDMAWMTDAIASLPAGTIDQQHSLKVITTFGMDLNIRRSIAERFKVPVRDAFGMTEVGSAIGCRWNDDSAVTKGTCGKVSPYRKASIKDPEGNDLPDGEVGELCIAGPGILHGYYKKPEATREAFHGEWFRTGDLAKRDEDGYFYIIGRIKDMIRRSGENISAAEVESVLSKIPGVAAVAAHAVKDNKRGEEVKVCLILEDGLTAENVSPEDVLKHASSGLARFKVPRYIQYYSEFPLTGSGKIAKKRLQDGEGAKKSGTYDSVSGAWSSDEGDLQ